VCSVAAAEDLARVAMTCGKRGAVQVMVDTGMIRSGVPLQHLDELLQRIAARPALRLAGVCTHFANAENCDDPFTREQLLRFRSATDDVEEKFRGRVPRHAANSAAVFFHPDSHFNMVRPGIALYGIDPTGKPCMDRPLRPALKWTAPLLSTKTVHKGTGVGYGQAWHAPRDTRIGLVPIGYADGYPRSMSNKAAVLIHGRLAPVVGRVSMDLMTVDLAEVPAARMGDEVTLLDDDPLSPVSVYKLAEWSETIPYEVVCRIGARVQRVVVEPERSGYDPAEIGGTGGPPVSFS
jgi:alanine racemase